MLTRRAFLIGCSGSAITAACGFASRYAVGPAGSLSYAEPDDTRWLQEALDGGGTVTLKKDRIYRVSAQHGARAALFIGSDTFLDLAGATLELAPNQRCAMIAQRPGGRVRNIRIANGTIVGNGARQPPDFRRDIGITPTLYFMECDQLALHDLMMRDTYMYALYAWGNDGVINNLTVRDAIGGGIHLNGACWRIDQIRVRNVSHFDPVNCTGNPFIVSLRDSAIGRVYCENYGFGVKLQDGCERITVDSIEAIGGHNNNDYLVKIQGKKTSAYEHRNRNIRIGQIVSRGGPNSGLYIYCSSDVEIDSYHGEANGRSDHALDIKNGADILIIDSDRIHFNELKAIDYPRHALWLHDRTGLVTAKRVIMESRVSPEKNPVVIRDGRVVLGGIEYGTPEGLSQ